MRAFGDGDLVQGDTGTASLASPVTVTIPAGSAEGDAGVIAMFAQTIIAPPEQWHVVASSGFGLLAVMLRADLEDAESSWPFSAAAGSPNWTWAAGEWANVASAPVETSVSGATGAAVSSLSTGATGSFATRFVMGVAAFGVSGGGAAGWPSVAYSNGFTETDSVTVGAGTATGDLLLKVARLYGADGDAGPWSCTATFTGSMTGKIAYAALAVFRAQETADAPIVTTS